MAEMQDLSRDYGRIERAIRFLESSFRRQPSLEDIAEAAGLSEFHFQRLFGRWVGITPKRFLQYLTKEHAKRLLEGPGSLLDAAYESGLSGPSRLHDLLVSCEAVTPGEFKSKGEGMMISYGVHPSPFGDFMIALTQRGICGLHFLREDGEKGFEARLGKIWQRAVIRKDQSGTVDIAQRVFRRGGGARMEPLHLLVKGTNFQIKVWEALLRIPLGSAVSYENLAASIGLPRATRAVGTAVGANPIPFLIPCHRVIRKTGEFGNYGEGRERKKAILGWESAILELSQTAVTEG
jgi:AraC family transcriptional regulator of adaptative response/methylated-DNA-[protein]-cysteine methyltransferase